jgi:hypothetical protein
MYGGEMLPSSPAAGRPREASNLPVRALTHDTQQPQTATVL